MPFERSSLLRAIGAGPHPTEWTSAFTTMELPEVVRCQRQDRISCFDR
jgi:hypothetical protein